MHIKDFLRGFSAGMIFTCGILFIVFKCSNQISDEYVIERAKQLNMGFLDESSFLKEDASESNENITTEEGTKIEDNTKEDSTALSEQDANSDISLNEKTVSINITKGMYSSDVSDILYELNIIEDKQEFNLYLHNHGYSSKIKIGEFEIPRDASYEEIARIITNS